MNESRLHLIDKLHQLIRCIGSFADREHVLSTEDAEKTMIAPVLVEHVLQHGLDNVAHMFLIPAHDFLNESHLFL